MIKLIASDMDGTLLDKHSQVPAETYDLILALRERGVRFAASSGRRYDRLCEFFLRHFALFPEFRDSCPNLRAPPTLGFAKLTLQF